jgi:hypothetical protein
LYHVGEFVRSPAAKIRRLICSILGELASQEATVEEVRSVKPLQHLISLYGESHVFVRGVKVLIAISDEDIKVVESAANALRWLATSADGAQAAMDANVSDHIVDLLGSPETMVRLSTSQLLGELASHESTRDALSGISLLYPRLVSRLQ